MVEDRAYAGQLVGGACQAATTAASRSIGWFISSRSMWPERRVCHFSCRAPSRSSSSPKVSATPGDVHGEGAVAAGAGGGDHGAQDLAAVVEGRPGHGLLLLLVGALGLTYREYVPRVWSQTDGIPTLEP